MMMPPIDDVETATDEEIIEAYILMGMSRSDAEVNLEHIRYGSDEFIID